MVGRKGRSGGEEVRLAASCQVIWTPGPRFILCYLILSLWLPIFIGFVKETFFDIATFAQTISKPLALAFRYLPFVLDERQSEN